MGNCARSVQALGYRIMNAPYAEINWDFNPLDENFEYPECDTVGRIHKLPRSCLSKECLAHLSQVRLYPFSIQLFVEPPNGYNPIHIDGSVRDHKLPSINWDLTTDRQGLMKWYKLKDGVEFPKVKINNSGTSYLQFNEAQCDVIHEHYVKGPCLIHTGIPHSLRNTSSSPRYCLSVRFFTTITFDYVFSSLKEKNWLS